jgi:hypothetical protein
MKLKKIIKNKIDFIKIFLFKNKLSHSFSLPVIISFFELSDNASSFNKYAYSVLILSIVGLFCFINVLGFLISYILILQGDFENKYPKIFIKLKRFINYYKKTTLIYALIETLFCLICFFLLIIYAIIAIKVGNF